MKINIKANYVIGVDGGNTKTDYFMFDVDGRFVDHIHDGTCSHERVGYEKAEEILNARIRELIGRHGLEITDVAAAAFGLAGIDLPSQQERFVEIIGRIGIPKFTVANDSFLGIVAGTSRGVGICSINGTGTVSGGIDPGGGRLQVGGIGPLVGDDAGGSYIARSGVRAVYDSFFRCGGKTSMTAPIFKLMGIEGPDELMAAISEQEDSLSSTEIVRVVFLAAGEGDGPALEIMEYVGDQLAKTSAGCIRNLDFGAEVEVALAGSVWVRAESPALFEAYKRRMAHYLPDKTLTYEFLKVPPATGAVLWAMSLLGIDCYRKDFRDAVKTAVEKSLAK